MTEKATNEAYADLAAAQAKFPKIERRRKAKIATKGGGSYEYRYADLSDVLEAVAGHLREHGFAIVQSVSSGPGTIGVKTALLHVSGGAVESDVLFLPAGSSPQDAGSAITYARRYSLSALLGIATEEDKDGGRPPVRTPVEAKKSAEPTPADREEGGAAGTSPPPTKSHAEKVGDAPGNRYPVDPTTCTHRYPSGNFLPWDDADRCPKCGTPKVSAVEGTTADLGPAEPEPVSG